MYKKQARHFIDAYFNQVRYDYPEVTLEQFKEICTSPFIYIKRIMEAGNLESIRLKYFGEFRVFPGRVKGVVKMMKKRLESGKMKQAEYDNYMKTLNKND